jgi:predicted metal-dependent phosphoesterase TrpH
MLCGREHTPCDTGAFWKLDMHVHSACSADSINTIQAIVHSWRKTRVLPLVCDHNSIRGSAQVYAAIRKEDPDIPQILSEEILTRDGDLIGVFLTEEITPGRPADETLDAIHSRGGLAIVPHPFCSYRDSRITPHVLEEITPRIDCIEAFNARNIRPEDNQLALSHARCQTISFCVRSQHPGN